MPLRFLFQPGTDTPYLATLGSDNYFNVFSYTNGSWNYLVHQLTVGGDGAADFAFSPDGTSYYYAIRDSASSGYVVKSTNGSGSTIWTSNVSAAGQMALSTAPDGTLNFAYGSTAYAYNPTGNSWSTLTPAGTLVSPAHTIGLATESTGQVFYFYDTWSNAFYAQT